jgi:hypothetical protein
MSCAKPAPPPENITLTLKRDGSHFYGTVVRRDDNSITVTGSSGDIHTFLLTELADQAAPQEPTTPSPEIPTPLPPGANLFRQPQGTQFFIRNNGFLDSCCVRLNDIALGILDEDIKSPSGVTLIPEGASVTFAVKDEKNADGRLSMTFELTTADYGGHHYLITPGAVMTITGERDTVAYTGEAAARGKPIHLESRSSMLFKASSPITFKLST